MRSRPACQGRSCKEETAIQQLGPDSENSNVCFGSLNLQGLGPYNLPTLGMIGENPSAYPASLIT